MVVEEDVLTQDLVTFQEHRESVLEAEGVVVDLHTPVSVDLVAVDVLL